MINVRLQIADGAIYDTYEQYGLIYLSSDNRFAPPTKGFATSTYAEESGEHIDPRTVDDAFDYKIRFCINVPNRDLVNANAKIKAFNELMYDKKADSDIKTFKEFTFYNDYKRVKVVGIPEPIAEVDDDDFFRDKYGKVYDAVIVELKLRVTDPNRCEFSTYNPDL